MRTDVTLQTLDTKRGFLVGVLWEGPFHPDVECRMQKSLHEEVAQWAVSAPPGPGHRSGTCGMVEGHGALRNV